MPYRRILLNIFFLLPAWVIRIFVWKKDVYIRGQVLDFKSSLLIAMTPSSLLTKVDFVDELRVAINEARIASPVSLKPSKNVKTFDHKLPSEETILLREYEPNTISTQKVILYFHGGGYVLGDVMTHDRWVSTMANILEAKIFSLNYRLAPENKFPKALDDSCMAIEWLNNLGHETSNISLCGDSAGAHLAASTSNHLSINNKPMPASQCLIYPMTDPSCSSESHNLFGDGYFLTNDTMIWFWEQLKSSNRDNEDIRFNLRNFPTNLENPKTLIITAGFDPLSDEGEEYAALLNKAGVSVEHIHYPNMFHGFVNMTKLKAAKYAAEDFLKDYKKIL
jgi:acetyl esterase